jgi:hypothetical protein
MIRQFPTTTDSATGGASKKISQIGHGFVVGDVLRYNSGTSLYVKALADSIVNAEAVGIVSEDISDDMFVVTNVGWVEHILSPAALTPGAVYFLSDVTAGLLTESEPSEGSISKPVFLATGITEGFFFNFRGTEIVSSTTSYYRAFTDADLVDGVLTVTHNLGHRYCSVTVFDDTPKMVIPDDITLTGDTTLTVNLFSYGPISGTWKVILLDVGTPNTTNDEFNGYLLRRSFLLS